MTPHHLSDDRLVEVSLFDAVSPSEQRHLESCPGCDARRVRLREMLDDMSASSEAAADAQFPASRLARQHARILAQLQHDGRPARIIAFPAGHAQELLVSRTHPSRRWIAAAAVAGLVVGVLAGRLGYDHSLLRPTAGRVVVTRAAEPVEIRAADGAPGLRAVASTISDEEFLSQLEFASDGPAAAALQPLDELTPLPWEVR